MEEPKNLTWVNTARRCSVSARKLIANADHNDLYSTGISEADMEAVQLWCEEHKCGRRVSFDTFQFRNKKELAFFLLKWS